MSMTPMKCLIPILILYSSLSIPVSYAQFNQSARFYVVKACGNTLTENSSCEGSCVSVEGVVLTTVAICGRECIKLPDGKTDKDMNIEVSASWQNDKRFPPNDAQLQPCGSLNQPGPCKIGWSRFETAEYYKETNKMCAKVKNWSSDQGVSFRVHIWQK